MKYFRLLSAMLICFYPIVYIAKDSDQECASEFVLLVTSYNCEKWVKENLRSICHLKSSKPYHIFRIDDCSTDNTGKIMDAYVKKHNLASLVTIIHNEKRTGMVSNVYNTIHNFIPDNKIVVNIDGDDRLMHEEVLLRLEQRYADPDTWLTYGSAVTIPAGTTGVSKKIPDWVFQEKKVRQHPFLANHLRTFRAGLFKKIKKEDLMHEGEFLSVAGDMAFMIPMLEMSAPKDASSKNHAVYIKELLYIHRRNNPLNVAKINRPLQNFNNSVIRAKPPYEPLNSLD